LSQIKFHGFIAPSDIREKVKDAHILVAPCRAEGKMPFVAHTKIYEYLALGRPIVAADLPAIREELIDGHNAYLFEPGNPDALADCLRKVISDPVVSLRLAESAKNLASSFSWKRRAERLESAFGVLVEKAPLSVHGKRY
jgi:glycosyltransferase involved in cell wall biosynthesis